MAKVDGPQWGTGFHAIIIIVFILSVTNGIIGKLLIFAKKLPYSH